MQAGCEYKSISSEERQGRAIVLVGVVLTLITLLVLLYGYVFHG